MSNFLIIGDDISDQNLFLDKLKGKIIYEGNNGIISVELDDNIFTLLPEHFKYHYTNDVFKLYKQANKIIIIIRQLRNLKFWLNKAKDQSTGEIIIFTVSDINNTDFNLHNLNKLHITELKEILNI